MLLSIQRKRPVVAIPSDHLLVCLCPVDCGITVEWIQVPFGVVGRTGSGVRQVLGFGIGQREGVILGANVGHPIVTNGDFAA